MIDAIRGEFVEFGPDFVCIETSGLTYQIFCPAETIRACRNRSTDQLYTHLVVRDDALQLFGFASTEARALFRKLLTVGQVGPKLALQILSSLPTAALVEAIRSGDVTQLTAIKGIGQKTAQRILIDLRDKFTGGGNLANLFLRPAEETALRALTSKALGFSDREARHAIHQLREKALGEEALVREALALLGQGR